MVLDPMKTIFIFFGPPGSGKGTLAGRAKEEAGIPVLSTGNESRKHVELGTELGKQLHHYMQKGILIPDTLITKMVIVWLQEKLATHNRVILDGFPRTLGQAESLQEFITTHDGNARIVPVIFTIPDAVILERLQSRLICANKDCQAPYSLVTRVPAQDMICDICHSHLVQRADDNATTVKSRLIEYHKHASALLPYLKLQFASLETINTERLAPTEAYEAFQNLLIKYA